MTSRKFFCTFPQALIQEPIISHTLNADFGDVPNIRAASITDLTAMVVVEIEGDSGAIKKSIEYMQGRGVTVEELAEGQKHPLA